MGSTIAPRRPGRTMVEVQVGDREFRMRVLVHELVPSLEGLRDNQPLIATPVRLAQGDTVQWPLPTGMFWLKYLPRVLGEAPPTITVVGPVSCRQSDGIHAYRVDLDVYAAECSAGKGATVKIAHGAMGAAVVDGRLAIERRGML